MGGFKSPNFKGLLKYAEVILTFYISTNIACMFGRHCCCIFPSMMNGFWGEVWNHYSDLTLRQSGAGRGDACLSGGQHQHCSVLSYCTSAQHLSSSSTESWWLISSHLFLPHYLFTKHKAGQGAVRSFTGKVFICLKLVNTVKCTEPLLCSAAVLQCSVIIRCRDADTLQLNNFTVQLHLGWFIYWASRTEKFLTRCKDYTLRVQSWCSA